MSDTLATLQSVDAFTTLTDGQPAPPGRIQLQVDGGWLRQRDAPHLWLADAAIQYAPSHSNFTRNMELGLLLAVTREGKEVELVPPIFGWQQRWVADTTKLITVATNLLVSIPLFGSDEFNSTLTGIVAKSVGHNTVFVNGLVGAIGEVRINTEALWVGYSRLVRHKFLLVGTYVLIRQEDQPTRHSIELATQFTANDRLSIGPGLLVGLNRASTSYGAGVRLLFLL